MKMSMDVSFWLDRTTKLPRCKTW